MKQGVSLYIILYIHGETFFERHIWYNEMTSAQIKLLISVTVCGRNVTTVMKDRNQQGKLSHRDPLVINASCSGLQIKPSSSTANSKQCFQPCLCSH